MSIPLCQTKHKHMLLSVTRQGLFKINFTTIFLKNKAGVYTGVLWWLCLKLTHEQPGQKKKKIISSLFFLT